MTRRRPLWPLSLFLSLTFIALGTAQVRADDRNHRYAPGEEVTVWLNRIGPYHRPQETYSFYHLPFCRPALLKAERHKHDSLGALLEGGDLVDSGIDIRFQQDRPRTRLCSLRLDDPRQLRQFQEAVQQLFWYQLDLDGLPVWAMVGEWLAADFVPEDDPNSPPQRRSQAFLYTHRSFSLAYNGDRVIAVNLTSERPIPLELGQQYDFTYSVRWVPTQLAYSKRMDRYLSFDFFELRSHWLSAANGVLIVLLLLAAVAVVLVRTLRRDLARLALPDDELELDSIMDESGWRQVQGDVFRAPRAGLWLGALLGQGGQLAVLGVCGLFVAWMGWHQASDEELRRGSTASLALTGYCLTAALAGFGAARWHKLFYGLRHSGRRGGGAMRTVRGNNVIGGIGGGNGFISSSNSMNSITGGGAKTDNNNTGFGANMGFITNSGGSSSTATKPTSASTTISTLSNSSNSVNSMNSMNSANLTAPRALLRPSGSLGGQLDRSSHRWKLLALTTTGLFPTILLLLGLSLNACAYIAGSPQRALASETLPSLLGLWVCVQLPLVFLGAIVGRVTLSPSATDSWPAVNSFRRPIPRGPWWARPGRLSLVAGLLPFAAAFVEVYFVFRSLWGHKFYHVYGFLLLIFLLQMLVAACASVLVTYLLLNAENPEWQWPAFASGLSSGLYVCLYAAILFVWSPAGGAHGLLQALFVLGGAGVVGLALGLVNGAVGYLASLWFVQRIYRGLKAD